MCSFVLPSDDGIFEDNQFTCSLWNCVDEGQQVVRDSVPIGLLGSLGCLSEVDYFTILHNYVNSNSDNNII